MVLHRRCTGKLKTFVSRDELKECLTTCGATLTETLAEGVDYLITNTPNSGTAKNKKAAPICALVALASLGSYWETALPLSFCALMMFAALILTLRHTQREENVI